MLTREQFREMCGQVAEGDVDSLYDLLAAKLKWKKPEGTQAFIARWCELWTEKYQGKALVSKAAAGIAKTIVNDHGLPRSLELLETYFQMGDAWFTQKRHDLPTLVNNMMAVAAGKTVTRNQAQAAERKSGAQAQLERIHRGDL